MSKLTYKCPEVTAPLPLESHINSPYASKNIFANGRIQQAQVSTGISLSYAVLEDPLASGDSMSKEPSTGTDEEARIVLLMGFSGAQEAWAPGINSLFQTWRKHRSDIPLKILTLDNRGCGYSDQPWGWYTMEMMAQDTLALMSHVGWEKAHIYGISMGGMIAQELAYHAPERVQSLTLGVTSRGLFLPGLQSVQTLMKLTLRPKSPNLMDDIMSFIYPEEFLSIEMEGESVRDKVKRFHMSEVSQARAFKPISWAGLLGQTSALASHFVSDARLKTIQEQGFPILIIGGAKDTCISVANALHFHEVMDGDNVHTVIYEHSGHGVNNQNMDEVAQDIVEMMSPGDKLNSRI